MMSEFFFFEATLYRFLYKVEHGVLKPPTPTSNSPGYYCPELAIKL